VHRATLLPLTLVAGLSLIVFASTTACGEGLVSPLDPDAFPTSVPATSPPPPTTTTTRQPTRGSVRSTRAPRSTTLTATPTPACLGPIVLPADTQLGSFCIEVGGVLRVEGTGPEVTVTHDPAENASYSDAGGAVELQFIRTGTVIVSIHRDGQIHPISVVVQ
jgi:hypothetical protein